MNTPDQMTATAERLYDEAYNCLTTGDFHGFRALCAPNLILNLTRAPNIRLAELEKEAENWLQAFTGYDQAPTGVRRFSMKGGTEMAAFTQHLLIHSGPFSFSDGSTIDATSREIDVRVATFLHARNGRIDRLNIMLNTDGFLAQMRRPL